MDITDNCLNLVKESEGLRLTSYQDGGGVWTIGYGHTKGVTKGQTITEEQAEEFLKQDIRGAVNSVNKLVKVPLNQNQFDALVDFTFNLGSTQLANSTLLRVLNTKNYDLAANQFNHWVFDNGKIQKGLIVRRQKETDLFKEPV